MADYRSAIQQLRDGKVDGVFGDGAIMLGFLDESSRQDFVLLDRLFTHEPLALAVPRGDEDFRLLVDRTLGQGYGTNAFRTLYTKWFGEFNDNARVFYLWNTPTP